MDYYIITGVSRGIGEAVARRFMTHGNTLFCASRTMNEDLVDLASSLQIPLYYYETDLSESQQCEKFINEVFSRIDWDDTGRIALINNAGMLEPVSKVETLDVRMMEKHLNLNILTPAILTSLFISKTRDLRIPKTILNISSGASTIPYSGWSMYCSSKAALDMFTKTVGLEQSTVANPVTIYALAPGIVDTAMQALIRQTDQEQFSEKGFFVKLHEDGKLISPDEVAGVIRNSMFNSKIPQGGLLSLELLKTYQ